MDEFERDRIELQNKINLFIKKYNPSLVNLECFTSDGRKSDGTPDFNLKALLQVSFG